ncbi:MAG TPA: hypothetical protein PKO22_01405 [Treponemataceae bacterium]|nr:hypothetical protein [Treponemataceae bacterium]
MKEIKRAAPKGLYTFPFLVFMYLLIAAAAFMLAGSAFAGVFSSDLFNTPRGILVLVVTPFGMLVLLGLFLFGIVSDSLHRDGARRFRRRVFLSVLAIVFLAAFPPTVIVGRYVGATLESWFSRSISESLSAAEDIVSLYLKERNRAVQNTANRFFTGSAIWDYRRHPTDWIVPMRSIDPEAIACQVYLRESGPDGVAYSTILETGDLGRFVPRESIDFIRDGFFSLPGDAADLNRFGKTVRYNNQTYVCAYASIIPIGFAARRELIADARERAAIIDRLKPFLPLMGVWIFVTFCLPIFLMAAIIAYLFAYRLSMPVASMCASLERVASGDASFFMVPHARDECAEAVQGVSELASRVVGASKKTGQKGPDKKGPDRL